MPAIDAAYRTVSVLADRDQGFQALCQALYGPGYDVDEVYRDVYIAKSSPDAADVHVDSPMSSGGSRTRKWALRVGLAGATLGTGAGGVAAFNEARHGVQGLRGLERVEPIKTKLIPTRIRAGLTPRRTSGLRAANGAFALGADTVAASVLHQKQRQIGKAFSVNQMTKGLLVQTRRATHSMLKHGHSGVTAGAKAAPAGATESGAHKAGSAIGRGIHTAVANPKQTAAAGIAGTGAAAVGMHHKAVTSTGQATGGYAAPQYYSKSEKVDVEFAGRISKVDKSKRLAFGWANVCKIDGQLVNDKQADVTMPEDLEDAVYGYNLNGRVGGDMHMRTDGVSVYPDSQQKPGDRPVHVSDLVESVMFTAEKKQAMGLPADFPEGWWTGFRYADTPEGEQAWQEVLAGKRPGFSIHGSGRREKVFV